MKLVYVTYDSFIDHSYSIIKVLKKSCDLKVIMIAKEMNDELKEWCRMNGAEFIQRKRYRNPISLLDGLKLLRKIKRLKYDLVWFNTLPVIQGMFAKIIIKNFLANVHDVEYHPDSKDYHSRLSIWFMFKLLKKNISVVSDTQAAIFQSKYGIKPKVFQLPVIDYYKDVAGTEDIKNPDYPNEPVKFFFFSSVEPYKGIETLIDAAELLEDKNIPFKLNIYGKLKYSESDLSNRINNLKNVTLYNRYVDYKDVHSVYRENDVLVLPYRQVTQCGPLLIGYSEGMPSICNDLPGFREYVVEGKSGIFFDRTATNLAEKMELFIKNKPIITEIREFILSEINNKFSMEYLWKTYIENFN